MKDERFSVGIRSKNERKILAETAVAAPTFQLSKTGCATFADELRRWATDNRENYMPLGFIDKSTTKLVAGK